MIAAIAALIAGAVFAFGDAVNTNFIKVSNCLTAQGNGDPFPGCPAPTDQDAP